MRVIVLLVLVLAGCEAVESAVMEEGSGWQWPFGDPFHPAPSF